MIVGCPWCHGLGHRLDGLLTVEADGTLEHVPATPCGHCRGSGQVVCRPMTDEELAAYRQDRKAVAAAAVRDPRTVARNAGPLPPVPVPGGGPTWEHLVREATGDEAVPGQLTPADCRLACRLGAGGLP